MSKINKKSVNKNVKTTNTKVVKGFTCGVNYATGFLVLQAWAQHFLTIVFLSTCAHQVFNQGVLA